ncbi:hypothetical protein P4B35_16400 [Pontiellaceae bacterium B12227]|nr:hypothetical protein [Pontiellaceae bacterium B12227]
MAVRMLSLVAVLLVVSFVFLRLYGVPDPILREIIKRVNDAGIPVHVESVMLTLRGWKAVDVSYYSRNPDDLGPLLRAREVRFDRKTELGDKTVKGWKLDIQAVGIQVTPSVEWGVNIPKKSDARFIDSMSLTLDMLPDRVAFLDGAMSWIGIDFSVDGVLLKKIRDQKKVESPEKTGRKQKTVFPVLITEEKFQSLETRLQQLKLLGAAHVKVNFSIDANNYSDSSVDFSLRTQELRIRGVEFVGLDISGRYAYPELDFDRVRLSRDYGSMELDASYDFNSKLIQANLKNSITSRELLLLAPQPVLDLLVKAQLQFEELPRFSLRVGPAVAGNLLNAIHGSFGIRDVTYCGLLIESVKGNIDRSNNYLDLSEIHATVQGQEDRAEEVGSSLHGGSAKGHVFWDANRETFGVEAAGSMDPNLLLEPLAIVPIATNAIGRFWFPEGSPEISLELGSSYTDWSTFFINVHGSGNDAGIHDGLLSSAHISAYYSNALLRLEPIAVMSGVDFMKGAASIDFRRSTVHFDAFGSLPPALLEDLTYADFDLFGDKIHTAGDTQMKAKGTLDWKTMRATDFRAEVEADHFTIPVAALDRFSAVVIGHGPTITVSNSAFGIYGGEGEGLFSVELDPEREDMPYSLDFSVKGADFKQCLQFVELPCRQRTKGLVSSSASIQADLRQNFFESANGNGIVSVDEGELADMPLFTGFSRLMRKVVPGFNTFSITSFGLDFELKNGEIFSKEASFKGDIFSAKAHGSYSQSTGYDAKVQVQMLSDRGLQKVIRVITNPIFKLFELRLSGPLSAPSWKLDNFTASTPGKDEAKIED